VRLRDIFLGFEMGERSVIKVSLLPFRLLLFRPLKFSFDERLGFRVANPFLGIGLSCFSPKFVHGTAERSTSLVVKLLEEVVVVSDGVTIPASFSCGVSRVVGGIKRAFETGCQTIDTNRSILITL
jgi:hypothetical protein